MRCELAAALLHKPSVIFLDEPTIGLDVIAKQRIRDLIGHLNTQEAVTVFLTSHDARDIEQVCRRAIVINHGEIIILDAPVARLKRDYLKVKTVDLLLEEPARTLLKIDEHSGQQRLSIQLPGSIHEEIQDTEGIQVLKAKEHGLKLAIDTSRSPLEPVIAAIMQHCHILDMTISDPPMEEIIATIYGQGGHHEQENVEAQFIAPIPSAPEDGTAEPGDVQGNAGEQFIASVGTLPEIAPGAAVPFGEGE
jgi:ABC-2 type transport system ATP-binding protein